MNLTRLQKMWLITRGGRDENDAFLFEGEAVIWMQAEKQPTMVRIPMDDCIHLFIDNEGKVRDKTN